VRQAPDFAELGEPGPSMNVKLEMKMVADVGIIGIPSVGKSTLISRITEAKPKIADYPFTTLVPNMGVVEMKKWGGSERETFVVADIPGLIEGAHEGRGLGDEFLRHISRTALLLHVLDAQAQDIQKDYAVIRKEMEKNDPKLAERPQMVVINKTDTLDTSNQKKLTLEMEKFLKKQKDKSALFTISAVKGDGLKEMIHCLWREIVKLRKNQRQQEIEQEKSESEQPKIFRPHLEQDPKSFLTQLIKEKKTAAGMRYKIFKVTGKRIEQIVAMSDLNNEEALNRIYHVMDRLGITLQLKRESAKMGDRVQIGDAKLEFKG
jgi:GTP-binding protein